MTFGKYSKSISRIVALAILLVGAGLIGHLGRTQYLVEHETIATTALRLYESNGFLFYALEDALMRWGADGLAERRRLSALSALLTLPLLWKMVRPLAGTRAALCSFFCLASNVLFIASGAYARFYAMNMLLVLLSTALLIWAARRDTWRAWGAYAALASAGVGTMVLSVLMLLPQAMLVRTMPRRAPRAGSHFLVAALAPVLMFALLWGLDPQGNQRFHYGSAELRSAGQVLLAHGSCELSLPTMYAHDLATSVETVPELWNHGGFIGLAIMTVAVWVAVWWRKRPAIVIDKDLTLTPRCISGLAGGILLALCVLFAYSGSVKVVISGENLSWLTPFIAIVFGCTMARWKWLRWGYLLALLLAPFWLWWATYFSCDTHDRYYNVLPLQRSDIIICMRYRPNQPRESAYTLAGVERNVADMGEAIYKNQPLYCDSEELLGGYLRQITCSPWARGRRVWIFYPWLEPEHWRELFASSVVAYCASQPSWQVRQSHHSWGQVWVMRVP